MLRKIQSNYLRGVECFHSQDIFSAYFVFYTSHLTISTQDISPILAGSRNKVQLGQWRKARTQECLTPSQGPLPCRAAKIK